MKHRGFSNYIKKADVILLIVLVALGLASSAALALHGSSSESSDFSVVIKSGGSVIGRYPLSKDLELTIPAPGGPVGISSSEVSDASATEGDECTHYLNYNRVMIRDRLVTVSEASCKNHVCVRHGAISRPGETIVCLPNRLVVSIERESEKGGGYDSISS